MENFDEAIGASWWLLGNIENGNIAKKRQDAINTVKDIIGFLKWAEERILELERG
jgi:hypothetical protein